MSTADAKLRRLPAHLYRLVGNWVETQIPRIEKERPTLEAFAIEASKKFGFPISPATISHAMKHDFKRPWPTVCGRKNTKTSKQRIAVLEKQVLRLATKVTRLEAAIEKEGIPLDIPHNENTPITAENIDMVDPITGLPADADNNDDAS